MEMQNFSVKFTVWRAWPYMPPKTPNGTRLYLNDRLVWPLGLKGRKKPPVMPAKGVTFRLEIPNGTLTGVITDTAIVDTCEVWTIADAVWTGRYSGLEGGKCDIGWFYFSPWPANATVKTSIADEPMTYGEYDAIRNIVRAACRQGSGDSEIWPRPTENQELFRSAWRHLKALRKEVEQSAMSL